MNWNVTDSALPNRPSFQELTTLRVGGMPRTFLELDSESDIVEAVLDADRTDTPLLMLGGGSNLVVSDAPFEGTVIRDTRQEVTVTHDSACGGTSVFVTAGTNWDQLVAQTVEERWSGLEALSGIPGVVGAAPVQNIGAYGREVAENIASVRALDRSTGLVRTLPRAFLELGYRDSILKRSLTDPEAGGGRLWGPTGRWVVLAVEFQMIGGDLSAPIRYKELARNLGVELGRRAPAPAVRQAVLALRRSKGMVLDSADHDTWSAGSFFTNPILDEETADKTLPSNAPRFEVEQRSMVVPNSPNKAAPKIPGVVKTSAAWLIANAGFEKGYKQYPDARASLSTKHVLAITNRGGATSQDIVDLAAHVRDGVAQEFGVELKPEPVFVGVSI